MNKTLRYFGLCYLQAVGMLAAAGAGFAVGALLEVRNSGPGLFSTYLTSIPFIVLLNNNFSRAACMHTSAESKRNVISEAFGSPVSTLPHVSTV